MTKRYDQSEPKYEIGDTLYYVESESSTLDINRFVVDKIDYQFGHYWYIEKTDNGMYEDGEYCFDQYPEWGVFKSREELCMAQIEYWMEKSNRSRTEILCDLMVDGAEKRQKELLKDD